MARTSNTTKTSAKAPATPSKPVDTPSIAPNTNSEKKRGGGRPRKNKENERPVVATKPISAGTQGVDYADSEDPQVLKGQIAQLTALLTAAQKAPVQAPIPAEEEEHIEPIPRPKGEAGNRKNGFVLKEAMRLNEGEENEALYNQILRLTRKNINRVNLDLDALYRQQDADKLANIFRLTRSKIPYLTRKRFPADWAISEIVKQYLANQRKEAKKRGKGKNRQAHGGDGDDDDDDDMEDQGAQSGNEDSGSDDEATTRSSKRRKVADMA